MPDTEQLLAKAPVIPVLVIDDIATAVPLARALVEGGLPVLEITLRTDCAMDAMKHILGEVDGAIVGAGTVTKPREFEQLERIGATFAISPGATPALYDAAADSPLPFLPGIATASELMAGLERGLHCFKFFPAAAAGGPQMLSSLRGPLPQARFCPTGGVTEQNMNEYLGLANVMCVGGSWLAPAELVRSGAWSDISQRASQAVRSAA